MSIRSAARLAKARVPPDRRSWQLAVSGGRRWVAYELVVTERVVTELVMTELVVTELVVTERVQFAAVVPIPFAAPLPIDLR